jgi:hypothetical protein
LTSTKDECLSLNIFRRLGARQGQDLEIPHEVDREYIAPKVRLLIGRTAPALEAAYGTLGQLQHVLKP